MVVWAVEDGKLVGYERSGKCNRCGDCCGRKGRISFQMRFTFADEIDEEEDEPSEPDWSSYEGWSILYAQGIWWWFKIAGVDGDGGCQHYDEDNSLCTIWKDDERFKPICRYWPFHPSNLEKFPNCGFRFGRVE